MSELRVTGGYEPNDPVAMSREEYHAALGRACRRGFIEGARWHMRGGRCNNGAEMDEAMQRWPMAERSKP